ncbi:hypothetical protein BN13_1250017 [Nostocoides jenkinsii Ben 74]|uniref:Uncharacterized protein n=1 Tax=Nostocoides jenkinsii Ben 74 TaxID=1193518 RepID=A0A077M3P7_9MICO|nr:hypothetical protein BN13_1250017 [Tetrasphaera jenkinsii Ben 74]
MGCPQEWQGKASLLDLTGFDARPRIARYTTHAPGSRPALCVSGVFEAPSAAPLALRTPCHQTASHASRTNHNAITGCDAPPWRTSPSNVPVRARATQRLHAATAHGVAGSGFRG